MKLDLACGIKKQPGFIGVDQYPAEGVDIIWDLNKYPYPFVDGSVDEIYCAHFIEHVDDLIKFMDELYRIMRVGATGVIIAPYWSHINAWRDPTHKRAIADWTMFFFSRDWRMSNQKDCYDIKTNFGVTFNISFDDTAEIRNMTDEQRMFALTHYINVASHITFNIMRL